MNSYLLDAKISELQADVAKTQERLKKLIKERQEICPHIDVICATTTRFRNYNEIKLCTRCGHHAFYGKDGYYDLGHKYDLPKMDWDDALNLRNKLTRT